MSKRRNREQGMFDGLKDAPTLEESSDAIFGASLPVAPAIKVKMIEIESIYPDPVQPRRAIPSILRERWNSTRHTFEELFEWWTEYMEGHFHLATYLYDGETERSRQRPDGEPLYEDFEFNNPAQASFIRLIELASSILRDGLTNPISVTRVGRDYMVETGERRWLAYHLLNIFFADDEEQDWSKIPARIMPERSIWRQATENNARQNINAVSRARQLAILLMEIHGWKNFRPINEFKTEQDFYAQVGDGHEWRIPADKSELLLQAMGLNNQTQLRQYRKILRCEPDIWKRADDEDWTEHRIRSYVSFKESDSPNIGRRKKSPGGSLRRGLFVFRR